MSLDDGAKPKREKISTELLNRFNSVADRADYLAQETMRTLGPVSREGGLEIGEPVLAEEPYPELFDSYRMVLLRIATSLDIIENCLGRVEI